MSTLTKTSIERRNAALAALKATYPTVELTTQGDAVTPTLFFQGSYSFDNGTIFHKFHAPSAR